MSEAERYARIAASVKRLHGETFRAFIRRLMQAERETGTIADAGARAAIRALELGGSPTEIAHAVDQALGDATEALDRHVQTTIRATTSQAVRAMDEGRISIGTAIENHTPGATQDFRSWDRAAARLRAGSARQVDTSVRLRARTEPARQNVVARVRQGMERGAGIRRITNEIRATDTVKVPLPRYVADVIDALNAGRMPQAAALRREAARLGSVAEAFATIKPQVERLALAVERGNLEAVRAEVEAFAARKLRYEATRIARTEAARAHTAARVDSVRDTPGVDALEWTLAGVHPVEDICDVYASADLYGLGPGRYPVDRAPSLPAHPNCMCTLTPVITAESIMRDLRGEPKPPPGAPEHETPEAWLRQQPEAVQARILGRGGAAALRAGETVIGPTGGVRPLWDIRGTPAPMREPAMLVQATNGRIESPFRR